jgi:hypothetical protein
MKIKVGDIAVPKHALGKVVDVSEDEVKFELQSYNGVRYTELTKEQAESMGITLEELVEKYVSIVEVIK